ncbi:MAG: transposase [bacterium]
MDVILEIGNMRFRRAMSFNSIHQELMEQEVPISPMGVQYQCRKYQALVNSQISPASGAIYGTLKKRGFILPIVDGITFGNGEAVVYLIMDSLSGLPLFGREMVVRGKDDLVPFISQVKGLGLPIIGVISDKEKGLAPAITEALAGVPQQYCQLHYIGNVAKPLDDDLANLGKENREKEEELRKFQREVIRLETKAQAANEEIPADVEIAKALCEAGRAAARRCGRELTEPAAIKQHEEIRRVEQAVVRARRKKGVNGNTLPACEKSCDLHQKLISLRGV